MGRRLKSFSGRLTRTIVIIVLVTMAIISLVVFIVTSSGIYTSFKDRFAEAIENISRIITANLDKVEISATNIADEVTWHITSPELIVSTLEYEISVNRNLTGCGMAFVPDYFEETGRWFEPYATFDGDKAVVKDIGSASHDYHVAEWFTSCLSAPGGTWSKPYLDSEGAGTLLCTYGIPITSPEGKLAGVLGADMSLIWLGSLLAEIDTRENKMSSMPESFDDRELGIFSFILGPGGDYIVHPDSTRFGGNYYEYADSGDSDRYRKLGDAMCAGLTGEETVMMDGRKYDVFYAPVSDSGWSMGIAVPTTSMQRPALSFGFIILLLILFGLMLVSLICRNAIKKFAQPLVQLAGSATEVARGKFDTKLPEIRSEDEIRLLRDSFDDMQKSLSKYIEELTETTAQKASMENELDIARNIQMAMLPMTWPAFPDRDDIDIFGSLTPAKAVGGDLYDFCIRDGKLFFCIGDVSGKGIPASLVMAVISSMFRTLSASEDGPDKIVSIINSSMAARNENLMFVTLFAGELDLKTGMLKYSNAGHNAPIILEGGSPRFLDTDSNIAVGIMPDWKYSLQTIDLSAGTVLFLYTDGLTEAAREDGSLFGEERVFSNLAGQSTETVSKNLVANMIDSVKDFVGDAEQSDDLTMLVLKVKGGR
ncbi:MAG: SpoIIE family protein phosphatase [Bacteroidales bacterium]|nr:SpoIIE family protein phosphatase [Bacteroidales bacterium]